MFLALKGRGMQGIFQKHGLKYVLGVGVIFQVQHTDALHHICIFSDCPVDVLFAAHPIILSFDH